MYRVRYVPFLKTADAELRALANLEKDVKQWLMPFFFLTKSRKIANRNLARHEGETSGSVRRRLVDVEQAWGQDLPFFLDVSSDDVPSSIEEMEMRQDLLKETGDEAIVEKQFEWLAEVRGLLEPGNGYRGWVEFIGEQKEVFPDIVPVLQLYIRGDENPIADFEAQVLGLSQACSRIAYRVSRDTSCGLNEEWQLFFIRTIMDILKTGDRFVLIIDLGYLSPLGRGYGSIANEIVSLLEQCRYAGVSNVVLAGSSFPDSITDIANTEEDSFGMERGLLESQLMPLYEAVRENTPEGMSVTYGGYSYVSPKRITSEARGWVPRIDVPLVERMRFFRKKAEREKMGDNKSRVVEGGYARAYKEVASAVMKNGVLLEVPSCWGKSAIVNAYKVGVGKGSGQGANPAFWISVKINIHLTTMALMKDLGVG